MVAILDTSRRRRFCGQAAACSDAAFAGVSGEVHMYADNHRLDEKPIDETERRRPTDRLQRGQRNRPTAAAQSRRASSSGLSEGPTTVVGSADPNNTSRGQSRIEARPGSHAPACSRAATPRVPRASKAGRPNQRLLTAQMMAAARDLQFELAAGSATRSPTSSGSCGDGRMTGLKLTRSSERDGGWREPEQVSGHLHSWPVASPPQRVSDNRTAAEHNRRSG